ncbi:MAG: GMP synthase [Gammaproteobacteria bacterium]
MNIVCITHADFETPGIIENWAKERDHNFKIVKPYRGESLTSIENFDFLIIMGGPQSAVKVNEFPYLQSEITLIQEAIRQDKKIIGFCLGAQLIGTALGASPSRSPEKEIGVFPITLTHDGKRDKFLEGLPNSFPVIHWHNDMPGLTQNAALLAFSEGCPRQIIRYLPKVYGFQCHLEITLDGIQTMIECAGEDLSPSKFTQTTNALIEQDYNSINRILIQILDKFEIYF